MLSGKINEAKGGSGEPMSEYDSDAMNKVRKQGIKKARTKNPAARMPPNRTMNPAEYRREQNKRSEQEDGTKAIT